MRPFDSINHNFPTQQVLVVITIKDISEVVGAGFEVSAISHLGRAVFIHVKGLKSRGKRHISPDLARPSFSTFAVIPRLVAYRAGIEFAVLPRERSTAIGTAVVDGLLNPSELSNMFMENIRGFNMDTMSKSYAYMIIELAGDETF